MNPVMLFQTAEVLPDTKYLRGSYGFTYAIRLESAQVTAVRPLSGLLKLSLEVNGVPTGLVIEIGEPAGGAPMAALGTDLGAWPVPAGQQIRWRAAFDGAIEESARQVSVTVTGVPDSVAGVTQRVALYSVVWEHTGTAGSERLLLYTYDPQTGLFTARSLAAVAGRASIVQDGLNSLEVTIRGQSVLRVAGGKVWCPGLTAIGGVATSARPVLRFQQDGATVASLGLEGLRVRSLQEGPAVPAGGFELWSGGVRTAAITMVGMAALAVDEAG